jgi:alpha-mannosidase
VAVKPNPQGPLAAGAGSLISVAEPNVLVVGTRQAKNGRGLLLRLWELAGKATTAHVRLGPLSIRSATSCNLVEEPQGPLAVRDGAIEVPIRGSGLATVRVE